MSLKIQNPKLNINAVAKIQQARKHLNAKGVEKSDTKPVTAGTIQRMRTNVQISIRKVKPPRQKRIRKLPFWLINFTIWLINCHFSSRKKIRKSIKSLSILQILKKKLKKTAWPYNFSQITILVKKKKAI